MNLFKKINRGLIATVIVLIAVAVYLVSLSISRADEENRIKEVCESYVKTAISYKMLPKEYRKEAPEIKKAELDNYISQMSKDLKAFYIDNEQSYKYVTDWNKQELENQSKGIDVVFNYSKKILKFTDFVYDKDVVTAQFESDSSFEGPDLTNKSVKRRKVTMQTKDSITLQMQEGKWKIVYADLQQPVRDSQGNQMVYRTY